MRVVRSDGVDWERKSRRNKTFEAGVTLAGLSLMSRAGYETNTALQYDNVGECESQDKNRYLYGDGADPTVTDIIYAWSYCPL